MRPGLSPRALAKAETRPGYEANILALSGSQVFVPTALSFCHLHHDSLPIGKN